MGCGCSGGPPLVFHNLSRCGEAEDGQRTRPDRTVLRQLMDPPKAYVSSHPPTEGRAGCQNTCGPSKNTHLLFNSMPPGRRAALAPFHRLRSHSEAPRWLRGGAGGELGQPRPSCPLPPALHPPQQAACLDVGSPENWGANRHPDGDRAPSSHQNQREGRGGCLSPEVGLGNGHSRSHASPLAPPVVAPKGSGAPAAPAARVLGSGRDLQGFFPKDAGHPGVSIVSRARLVTKELCGILTAWNRGEAGTLSIPPSADRHLLCSDGPVEGSQVGEGDRDG